MKFQKALPSNELSRFVECYWMISDDSNGVLKQKIVPDGFPEIIVHLGDPYRINIHGDWVVQSRFLIAGQLKKYFYLENTGRSSVFGIKFKPAAIRLLFQIEMSSLTDNVIDFDGIDIAKSGRWKNAIIGAHEFDHLIKTTEQFLIDKAADVSPIHHPVERSLDVIFFNDGACSIQTLAASAGVGTRQLELYYKKYVGLSPKFYSRVVRFSKIFQLVQEDKPNWMEIAHLSGYFDQAHFIRNFKAFTGEEPGRYGFDKLDFANFFLMKRN